MCRGLGCFCAVLLFIVFPFWEKANNSPLLERSLIAGLLNPGFTKTDHLRERPLFGPAT